MGIAAARQARQARAAASPAQRSTLLLASKSRGRKQGSIGEQGRRRAGEGRGLLSVCQLYIFCADAFAALAHPHTPQQRARRSTLVGGREGNL
eukprot:2238990-Rhodomonas_salina.2